MIEQAKNISLFLLIGLILTAVTNWLESDFIVDFLSSNLITLLIALIAINTTTLSVVLTKIREISDRLGGDFSNTAREMKLSLVEQVILVVVTTITQVMKESVLVASAFPSIGFISSVIMIGVFAYAIHILYDTANSIFVILNFENTLSQNRGEE